MVDRVRACLGSVDHAVRYWIVDCVSVSDDAVTLVPVEDVVEDVVTLVGAVMVEDG